MKPKKAVKKKPVGKKAPLKKKKGQLSDDEDDSDNGNSWRTSRSTRGGGKETKSKVDYVVPDTDEDVDEDTVQSWTIENEEEVDNSPTVEKVLDLRQGLEGATGPATTTYSVETNGDPNVKWSGESKETQYLIKWKGYSHLHNTWESDRSLADLTAKGVKKVENFTKRMDELSDWKLVSSPEDIEYMECQLQMQQQLQVHTLHTHTHILTIIIDVNMPSFPFCQLLCNFRTAIPQLSVLWICNEGGRRRNSRTIT